MFDVSNNAPGATITAVGFSPYGNTIAVGTSAGVSYRVKGDNGNIIAKYNHHTKKISDISIREGISVITSSFDGSIYIQSLDKEKAEADRKSFRLKLPGLYEVSCFYRVNALKDDELLIGTGLGDVHHWKKAAPILTSITAKAEEKSTLIQKSSSEGQITLLQHKHNILVHANRLKIRIDHYPNQFVVPQNANKPKHEGICFYDLNDRADGYPENMMSNSYVAKPSVSIIKREPQKKNIQIIVTWWNIFKVSELRFNPQTNKYELVEM